MLHALESLFQLHLIAVRVAGTLLQDNHFRPLGTIGINAEPSAITLT
jgi:hypothetical protein